MLDRELEFVREDQRVLRIVMANREAGRESDEVLRATFVVSFITPIVSFVLTRGNPVICIPRMLSRVWPFGPSRCGR